MGQLLRLSLFFAFSIASFAATAQSVNENNSAYILIEAVQRVSYNEVTKLIESGVDVNASRADGSTALSWAAQRPDIRIVTVLLEAGADPNSKDENDETPLLLASARGNQQIVEALINAGANIKVNRWSGDTPLHVAIYGGNLNIVQLLIEEGADVNAIDSRMGQSPLMRAAASGNEDIARVLIENGANLNAASSKGFRAIHIAALYGKKGIAEMLVSANAETQIPAGESGSPFLIALSEGYEEVARLLLTDDVNVNLRNLDGSTPLHEAAGAGMMELTRDLVERGADLTARLGTIPGNIYEPGRGGGTTPFLAAARGGHVNTMHLLLSAGANPHDQSDDGAGSVLFATRSLNIEAIRLLLELDADVNATPPNRPTALHTAIRFGEDRIVEYLADNGANFDVQDHNSRTPLQEAEFEAPRSTIELMRRLSAEQKN